MCIKNVFCKAAAWLAAVVLMLAYGCGAREKAELQAQVDSLKVQLETSQRLANTLLEVGVLMDSIDASRQLLRINMVEGTTYDDYTARMKDINKYVKETENKISELEKALRKSGSTVSAYARQVAKLKADLEVKTSEIMALQEQVERYRSENRNLSDLATMLEDQLSDKEAQIRAKEQELALIEARIQQIMIQAKVSEADAAYARAQAMEEAANRTKLAPRKKKETLKEALDWYKKAYSLGKKEAGAKISELEKKMN
jgi:chromosome segregation ATPase